MLYDVVEVRMLVATISSSLINTGRDSALWYVFQVVLTRLTDKTRLCLALLYQNVDSVGLGFSLATRAHTHTHTHSLTKPTHRPTHTHSYTHPLTHTHSLTTPTLTHTHTPTLTLPHTHPHTHPHRYYFLCRQWIKASHKDSVSYTEVPLLKVEG